MRAVLFILLLLVPLPASAEMLLMTIDYDQSTQSGQAGIGFGVMPDSPGPSPVYWRNTVAIGASFEAPPEILAGWNAILPYGEGTWFSLNDGLFIQNGGIIDWLWHPFHGPSFGASPAVPQLGPGLSGYRLTRATQTIHDIRVIGGPITFTTIADETIRLYGEIIPEPASVVLLLFAHVSMLSARRVRGLRRCPI